MPLEQTPPEGRGRRKPVHFSHEKTHGGIKQQWHAWVAGRCHWFDCHNVNRKSKPCLHHITNGELPCEFCSPTSIAEMLGYQPLYRGIDAKPVFVVVHEYVREDVDKLHNLTRVIVGRGEGQTDGVYVVPALTQEPRYHSTLPDRLRPADLTETLLRVWAMPLLTEWYYRTHQPTNGAAAPVASPIKKKTQMKSDGKPFSPLTQAAAQKYSSPDVEPEAARTFDDALEKMKKRKEKLEANGKHD